MRVVWTDQVREPFTVRDVLALLPELAYTTVLTTMRRLADKGVLVADAAVGRRAYDYCAAGGPADFLATESTREAAAAVQRYGDAALAAFAARLDALDPQQRAKLERLRNR
ncbi:MAG: BlaI/MecI/CopY family transcriptional regulator [Pseudonocardiaceae bacterium]|nr:BlaI/MecI/CopY family transcriptional regulator [Pseudonocardiaceae bacterium]